jgi:hypothetical protein
MYSTVKKAVVVLAMATVPAQAGAFAPSTAIKSVTGNAHIIAVGPRLQYAQ